VNCCTHQAKQKQRVDRAWTACSAKEEPKKLPLGVGVRPFPFFHLFN